MKFRSSCCCWLTLLLVGSSVISVSPNSSTTATTTFQQQSMHPVYVQGTETGATVLLSTANTNKLKSLENYLFASATTTTTTTTTTMSLESAPTASQHYQHLPVTGAASVQQLLTLASSSSSQPPQSISRTTTTTTASTSSSSSSLSVEASSSDVNSIERRRRRSSSHHGDNTTSAASVSSVTEAMVHHHYSTTQQKTTESYPSMFFQMSTAAVPTGTRHHLREATAAHNRIERDVVQNDDAGMDKCRLFVEGEPDQNILYSPDYPSDYPKNINCTRIIEAPKGQLIRLDFRNSFNIEEKEDCKFDYLEIRDGPYGFSNLIGRYCGEEFPPMITSKERHLWLHFHSDESIEYSGFTAVYEFIDRPKEAISTELNCTIEKDGYEGFINSTDVPLYVLSNVTKYKIPLDCMWIIRVKEKWKIQVKFLSFSLNKPNDCDINFIDIFAEDTNIPSRVKNFCGSTGEPMSSESNILHIRFFAEQIAMNSSFQILYTAFRDKGTANCAEGEYDCEDATCISDKLKCNGRDNCKFRWDEEGCKSQIGGQSEHVIIIIVVFGLILGGMIVTFLVNCVRKIMRDQKIIREHIRQSKESKLDEMGRLSKQRSRDNVSGVLSPRQKHSQTSLQILDDVSQRYYREVVPISVQTGKTDLKDHSILRHHHDMVVQTSLCDDSSTPDRGMMVGGGGGVGGGGAVCDMGCQTRESLFQPLARQKSMTSSSPNQSTAAAIRFSTFGYDIPPPPPPSGGQKPGTLSRQSSTNNRQPSESIELEERLRTASHHSQHHHSHSHIHGGGGGGSGVVGSGDPSQAPTMRLPQEMCHHHHQHQQHLQKHQMQQQQQPPNPGTMGSQQHSHQPPPGSKSSGGKHHKLDETSKVFIDIRNSAPDVIIMTSH